MSIITLGGILVGQIIASRKLLDTIVGHHQWVLIIFWLMVVFYTMFGGLRAVVAAEIFQGLLVFIVFSSVLAIVIFKNPDIIATFRNPLALLAVDPMLEDPFNNRWWILFLMPFFYALFAQDLAQRLFAAKTPGVATISALCAGVIVLIFSMIPVILGIGAHHLGVEPASNQSVLLLLLNRSVEPFFYYLAVCAIIAAISSTADAMLCAMGSNVVHDFILPGAANIMDKPMGIVVSRLVILATGIFALIIGYCVDDILGILSISYELSVSILLVPILFSFIVKHPQFEAAAFAMIGGFVGFVVFRLFSCTVIRREILSLLVSLAGYAVGHVAGRLKKTRLTL